MALDLTKLTPDDIAQLKALLGVKEDADGRSPIWRPLTDMRPPKTARGRLNRPHFEQSAEEPPEGTTIPAFPRLFWDGAGIERKIHEDQLHLVGTDWTSAPPLASAVVDPMIRIQAEFDALSPEDQQFVLNAQKQARLSRLHSLLADLPDQDVASLNVKPALQAVPALPKEKKTA